MQEASRCRSVRKEEGQMTTADDLLRRLVELEDVNGEWDQSKYLVIIADASAYLSREKGPVAEMRVLFAPHNGAWHMAQSYSKDDTLLRVEVPAHIVSPPTVLGEVVEGA